MPIQHASNSELELGENDEMGVTYISASTNRHGYAADSSDDSLIAFGTANLLALWDASDERDPGISQTIPGHEGGITAVRFFTRSILISADDKGFLRVWRREPAKLGTAQALVMRRKCASTSNINIFALQEASEQASLTEVQTLSMSGKYPLSLALARLPHSNALILAVGSTDRNTHIFTRSESLFVKATTLPGHEDWVRALAFNVDHSDVLVLASGSQDATIRLWNIEPLATQSKRPIQSNTPKIEVSPDFLSDELLDAFEASLGDLAEGEEGGRQISLKRHMITVKSEQASSSQFSIMFDALLVGHEQGITSLCWRQPSSSTSSSQTKAVPTLLSTSTDSSVILWSPSEVVTAQPSSSIWVNRQRFGDIGGQRLGGFVGGLWSRSGKEVLAWGWSGGWRRWRCTAIDDANESWFELGAIGGHKGPVKGMSWSPKGEYLISAGVDQTTRIHGPVPIAEADADNSSAVAWHELARPQVHGYDLIDALFLSSLNFVSIADEKVVRVFEAPRNFVDIVEALKVVQYSEEEHNRPLGASVPPLGLSNKAMPEAGTRLSDPNNESPAARRPFEGELAATMLWPETEKVFGHGYESISLAVSTSKQLIATACKSTSPTHAVVRVYDTTKYQPIGEPLQGHTLTVTRIAFSPDDRHILSVSRDRTWMISELQDTGGYKPVAIDKSHARIIWDCAWSHEGDIFATASRDKTVKLWKPSVSGDASKWAAIATIKTKEAATAVDLSPADHQNRRRLAIGLESGEVLIYSSTADQTSDWKLDLTIEKNAAHVDHIHRLCWRPPQAGQPLYLASCSEDGSVKVTVVHLTDV
ncbi:hypothetical protein HGRIS_009803 [Hohenbuehelia grisea]|uniref:Elongator complex protein 2 n=1 Tax=Hohenbuehelia grisea TaxID=104357 RepID=A0ABR3J2C1_9AGAR